ncbi:hypothetical protein TDB9533_02326 [Thalassocella blandensis]|nr:hypothetical protein TDB9533_02326 [Thalassocella blandensis]
MKGHCKLLCSLFLITASSACFADKDKGVYAGAGIDLVNVGAKDFYGNGVTFKTIHVNLGYKYHPFLGIEVRGGASIGDETIAYEDLETPSDSDVAEAGIDMFYSVYYRAEWANEIAKLYLLLGQSALETTYKLEDNNNIESSESGFSYGLGFGLWLDEKMNLNIEYKVLADLEVDTFKAFTIAADYRF